MYMYMEFYIDLVIFHRILHCYDYSWASVWYFHNESDYSHADKIPQRIRENTNADQ